MEFIPAGIIEDRRHSMMPSRNPPPRQLPVRARSNAGSIEIALANGSRVTVGRGCDRGGGLRAGPLPGDPPCLAEIRLHRVRCDHPGPGTADADAARACDTAPVAERVAHRRETAPLLDARFDWAGRTVSKLSGKLELAKAFRYTITRREALTRFGAGGRRTTTWPRM